MRTDTEILGLKTVSLTSSNTLFLPLLIPSLRAFIHDSFSSKVGAWNLISWTCKSGERILPKRFSSGTERQLSALCISLQFLFNIQFQPVFKLQIPLHFGKHFASQLPRTEFCYAELFVALVLFSPLINTEIRKWEFFTSAKHVEKVLWQRKFVQGMVKPCVVNQIESPTCFVVVQRQ